MRVVRCAVCGVGVVWCSVVTGETPHAAVTGGAGAGECVGAVQARAAVQAGAGGAFVDVGLAQRAGEPSRAQTKLVGNRNVVIIRIARRWARKRTNGKRANGQMRQRTNKVREMGSAARCR